MICTQAKRGLIIKIKIKLANPRGFCAGVRRAIDIAEQAIKIYGSPIYVRHELVHNDYVIAQLSKKGLIFVENLNNVPNGSILIFSAHGVSKAIKAQAKNKNLKIFDATCPLVSKVHMEVSRASRNRIEVILIGHGGHPEVEGTIGQYDNTDVNVDTKIHLVESKKDAWLVKINQPNNLCYVTQTTLSIDDTAEIIKILHQRFPNILGPKKNDICYATFNRQGALKNLTLLVEIIFVIGSITSSNSNRLLELARNYGKPAYLINKASDIQKEWLHNISSIGITAGASAPEILVQQILEKLRMINSNFSIEEVLGKQENVFFDIPHTLMNVID